VRQAPPVGVTCTGRGAWRVGSALLAALAAASVAAWASAHALLPVLSQSMVALLAALAAGAFAWVRAAVPPAQLVWDGAAWRLDGEPGRLAVALDLGGWLLLRFDAEAGGRRWLPVGAAEAGAAWHALRCAVLARTTAPAP
jgi:hypothetical protein